MFKDMMNRFNEASYTTKGVVFSLMIAGVVAVGFWFKLEFLEPGNYLVSKQVAPDGSFRIDAYGKDWRGYTFSPPNATHKTCIIVTGTNKMEMECFDRKEPSSDPD